MRLLELFSGSKSVSKAVGDRFDEIVSVDIIKKYDPTICCDILEWDYTTYPSDYFDAVWASPPCCEYSILNKSRPDKVPDLDLADSIVQRTIEIIEYFNPPKWFIENPDTGELKNREFMFCIPFYTVDYCKYSNWGYRKRTRIWTNVETFVPLICKKDCENMDGNRHRNALGNSGYQEFYHKGTDRQLQRYAIPEKLIQSLFDAT